MHKKDDVEAFLIEKFLRGPEVRLFISDSIRFRLELANNKEGRFLEKELQFIFRDSGLVLEFKEWENQKNLQRMTSFMQQAGVLINSQ